tara:strand:+ start:152 stop:454 length:303 start_codon:yes stop_codon:yes gene_type:complete
MLNEDFALSYAARKLGRSLSDEEVSLVLSLPDRRAIREWAYHLRDSTLVVKEAMPKKEVKIEKESELDEQEKQSKPNKGIKKKKYTNTRKSNDKESSTSA